MKKTLTILKFSFLILFSFYASTGLSQSTTRTVYGKIYYKAKGQTYPASYKRIVIMPNTTQNLALARNLYNHFDDSTIKKIRGARSVITSKEGDYEFNNVLRGRYIIRVTGMGGMVIKFEITSSNYTRKRIPDMPADYY